MGKKDKPGNNSGDLFNMFGFATPKPDAKPELSSLEEAGLGWLKTGFTVEVAMNEDLDIRAHDAGELNERASEAKRARFAQYNGTWYCRHCETIFTGIPKIVNHDPMGEEKWDITICVKCGEANPFTIFPLECEYERKELTYTELHRRETLDEIFCESFHCLINRSVCETCDRYRPTGFQRKKFRRFLEQRNEKIIEKVE